MKRSERKTIRERNDWSERRSEREKIGETKDWREKRLEREKIGDRKDTLLSGRLEEVGGQII